MEVVLHIYLLLCHVFLQGDSYRAILLIFIASTDQILLALVT